MQTFQPQYLPLTVVLPCYRCSSHACRASLWTSTPLGQTHTHMQLCPLSSFLQYPCNLPKHQSHYIRPLLTNGYSKDNIQTPNPERHGSVSPATRLTLHPQLTPFQATHLISALSIKTTLKSRRIAQRDPVDHGLSHHLWKGISTRVFSSPPTSKPLGLDF